MSNEERLFFEAVMFVVFMLVLIAATAYSVIVSRRNSPDEIDMLRKLVKDLIADMGDMNTRFDEYDQQLKRNRIEMDRLHSDLTAWKNYSRKWVAHGQALIDLLHEMGYTGDIPPQPEPPPAGTPPAGTPPPYVGSLSLPNLLARAFNNEELDNLATDIGALPDDLLGQSIKRRATSLVLWAQRHGCLNQLVDRAHELRPNGGFKDD